MYNYRYKEEIQMNENKAMLNQMRQDWQDESDYIDSVLAQTYEMEETIRKDYLSVKETLDQAKAINWFLLNDSSKELYFKTVAELNAMIARIEDRMECVLSTRSILLQLRDNADNWEELTGALQELV